MSQQLMKKLDVRVSSSPPHLPQFLPPLPPIESSTPTTSRKRLHIEELEGVEECFEMFFLKRARKSFEDQYDGMARITQRVSSLEEEIVSLKEQLEEAERKLSETELKLRETDSNLREFKDAVQDAL